MQCRGFMVEEGLFHMKGIFLRPFWRQHGLLEKVGGRWDFFPLSSGCHLALRVSGPSAFELNVIFS